MKDTLRKITEIVTGKRIPWEEPELSDLESDSDSDIGTAEIQQLIEGLDALNTG
jgi:hypothetical protein